MNAAEKAKLARLKRDVSMGIKNLEDGRFKNLFEFKPDTAGR